jgi:hypothetical protein
MFKEMSDDELLNQIEAMRKELVDRGSLKIPLGFKSERYCIALSKTFEQVKNMTFSELLAKVGVDSDEKPKDSK